MSRVLRMSQMGASETHYIGAPISTIALLLFLFRGNDAGWALRRGFQRPARKPTKIRADIHTPNT